MRSARLSAVAAARSCFSLALRGACGAAGAPSPEPVDASAVTVVASLMQTSEEWEKSEGGSSADGASGNGASSTASIMASASGCETRGEDGWSWAAAGLLRFDSDSCFFSSPPPDASPSSLPPSSLAGTTRARPCRAEWEDLRLREEEVAAAPAGGAGAAESPDPASAARVAAAAAR